MKENVANTREKTRFSEPKDRKQSDHDADTKSDKPSISLGSSLWWSRVGSGQADEPLPKRNRSFLQIALDTRRSQAKHGEVLVKTMEVELSE